MTAPNPGHRSEGVHERRRPTIHDVARDAGISKTSVSRYFGHERALLSEAMTKRIEAAIERLGFSPDRLASGLRGRRTGLIGMVVADMRNPYTVAMLHGAELACREHGYSLLICSTDNSDSLEQRHMDVLHGYSVEGLVVNTCGRNATPLAARLEAGVPMVLVDRHIDGLDCDMVGLDNEQAVTLAVSHLFEQGYQRLLMLTEPATGISARETRLEVFRDQTHAAGLAAEIRESPQEPVDPDWLTATLAQWLETAAPPGAIVCANGVMTLAVCHALFRLFEAPFDRVGVLGIDELDWCALVGPGITTVAQPVGDIGYGAIKTLLARIQDAPGRSRITTHPASLHPRGSTRLKAT